MDNQRKESGDSPRKRLRDSTSLKVGLALLVFGSGPLIVTLLLAKAGLTKDPNPNPVLFGIMTMLTFYPGLALIGAGILGTFLHNRRSKKK